MAPPGWATQEDYDRWVLWWQQRANRIQFQADLEQKMLPVSLDPYLELQANWAPLLETLQEWKDAIRNPEPEFEDSEVVANEWIW